MIGRLGGGLRMGLAGPRASGYAFANAEAAALVARMTAPPSEARKAQIDTLVGALKTGGVWAKLDFLYVLAAHDAQAARLNWIADQFNATVAGAPTFAADRGYTAPAGTAYLDSGFNASTAAGKFAQNSCHIQFWSRTNSQSAGVDIGATNTFAGARTASDTFSYRISSSNGSTHANADSRGHFVANRTAAGAHAAFRNGASLGTGTVASAALDNGNFRVLRSIGTSFSGREIAMAAAGSSLSAGEVTAAYEAISAYLTAVGAA